MQTTSHLKQQAIKAAKQKDWHSAISHNQAIIAQRPDDIGAFNRMGVAYLQLGKAKKARDAFTQTLGIDKTNTIAQKQLAKLKQKNKVDGLQFSGESFIEEPGKTKSVELHRIAGKDVLEGINPGATCELKLKKRYISVLHEGSYLGALPEDISYRLSKLISSGNTYKCQVQSVSSKHCRVFLTETYCHPSNEQTSSFPTNKANGASDGLDDKILFDENIPIQIVSTDADVERTFEDVKSQAL